MSVSWGLLLSWGDLKPSHWMQGSGSSTHVWPSEGCCLPQPRGPWTTHSQVLWQCEAQPGDNQMLLRPSSSHPAYSDPETTLVGRRDDNMMGYAQLKVNNHFLLSTTQVFVSSHTTSAKAIFQGTKLRFYYWSLWEGCRKVIAFVCAWTHKLTPGTLFMAGGSFTRRGESSKHTYPWLWCVTHLPSHSSSRLWALITWAFPTTASLSCFHLATATVAWEERGRGKRVRKRNKKRKIWGWKSQLGRVIWKELTCCQAEMKALKTRDVLHTY